jgi:CMP-N-acetylneuraminic acid synthetase
VDNFKIVIPARMGSKGFSHKNRKLLYNTLKILSTWNKNNIILTSNDPEVIKQAKEWGIKNILFRDEKLSNDTASMKDVLLDVVKHFKLNKDTNLITLYLTYPNRTMRDIYRSMSLFNKHSLLCLEEPLTHPYMCMINNKPLIKHNLYRRQDYPEIKELSHYIVINNVGKLKQLNNQLFNNKTEYMNIKRTNDVDYEYQL